MYPEKAILEMHQGRSTPGFKKQRGTDVHEIISVNNNEQMVSREGICKLFCESEHFKRKLSINLHSIMKLWKLVL